MSSNSSISTQNLLKTTLNQNIALNKSQMAKTLELNIEIINMLFMSFNFKIHGYFSSNLKSHMHEIKYMNKSFMN